VGKDKATRADNGILPGDDDEGVLLGQDEQTLRVEATGGAMQKVERERRRRRRTTKTRDEARSVAAEEPRRVLRHVLAVRRAVQLLLLGRDARAGRAVRLGAVARRAAKRLLALALLLTRLLLRLDGRRRTGTGLALLRLAGLLLLRRTRIALLLLLRLLLLLLLGLVVAVELRLQSGVVGRHLVAVRAVGLVRVVVRHAAVERVLGRELLLLLSLLLSLGTVGRG